MDTLIRKTIRKHRVKKGYSQEYLAYKIGISQSLFAKIENGMTKLTIDRIVKIAETLNVKIETIFGIKKKYFKKKNNLQKKNKILEKEINSLKTIVQKYNSINDYR